MGQVANTILSSAALTRRFAEAMLKDVKPEQFARLASPGGTPVQSNHPAFVFGHLALYFPRIPAALGKPANEPPAGFADLFTNGKPCLDDPTGKVYPSMEAITTCYFKGLESATAALKEASDADLAKPNPAEGRMKEMFPTIGDLANFIMSVHPMSHMGQVSAWRRMMGLGSAM